MERIDGQPGLTQEETVKFLEEMAELGGCREADPDIFFADPDEIEKIAAAKAICRECGMIFVCLQYAVANGEQGVWGGKSEAERRPIVLRRENGVVRKFPSNAHPEP